MYVPTAAAPPEVQLKFRCEHLGTYMVPDKPCYEGVLYDWTRLNFIDDMDGSTEVLWRCVLYNFWIVYHLIKA